MALETKAGYMSLTSGSSGSVAVTGIGFQPKLVIFFPTRRTSLGAGSTANQSMGASTGSGNNFTAFCVRDEDGQSTSDSGRTWSNSHCILSYNQSSDTVDYSATMTSLDSDGFTVNFDDAPGGNRICGYLCIGGSDVSAVEVGSYQLDSSKTAGQTQDITLSGAFQPTGLILASAYSDSSSETAETDANMGFGFTDFTSQYGITMYGDDNQSTSECNHATSDTSAIIRINATGSLTDSVKVDSALSDGFRLEYVDDVAADYYGIYIAIKGPQFHAGDYDSKTSTGTITSETSACGFQPQALMIFTDNTGVYNPNPNYKQSIGITTGATENWCTSISGDDGESTTDTGSLSASKCLQNIDKDNNIIGEQELDSFTANGFEIDQTDADSNGPVNCTYLAIGPASSNFPERYYPRGSARGVTRGVI